MVIQKNWQDLIKPNKLDVRLGSERRRVATMVAEPLERGFGLTLGNALRRVLLSSLQGAAVTSVQIDGVLHEFSSIAGVRKCRYTFRVQLPLRVLNPPSHLDWCGPATVLPPLLR